MMTGNDFVRREVIRAELKHLAARLAECERRLEADPADPFAAMELVSGMEDLREYTRELREIDRRLAAVFRGLN